MVKTMKKKFMTQRQVEGEIVMSYRDKYGYFIQFTRDLVTNDANDAFYFGDGLRWDITRSIVSTSARSLQETYEWALSYGTYELGREEDGCAELPKRGDDYEQRGQRGKRQRR
ncbi:hypothetical protein Scep_011953 [Stephania cephalantha]|uniref:Uncharacterized protein n=1 Tax=Stephania cephalantha TaxID=152367 RepID=A0AAP0JF59_9MAGN